LSDKNNVNSPEMDELWQLFAQEERDNLDLTEDALLRLEKNFSDAEQIAVLFRSIHSLKGGARMMGLSVLEETAHHAENLAALVRDAGVKADEEIIDILLKTTDLIRQQLAVVLEKRCDVSPETTEDMVRQLEELIDRKKGSEANAPRAVPPESPIPQNVEEEDANPDDQQMEEQSAFIPTSILPSDVEKVVPATDAQYLRIFFEMADAEMERLQTALQSLSASQSKPQGEQQQTEQSTTCQTILAACLSLQRAARRMGYKDLLLLLEQLEGTLRRIEAHGGALLKKELKQLKDRYKKLSLALKALRPSALDEPGQSVDQDETPRPARFVLGEEPAVEPPPTGDQIVIDETAEEAAQAGMVSLDSLNEILEYSGEIIADHSILQNLISRMARNDLAMCVRRAFASGDEQAIAEMNDMLEDWEKNFQSMKQVSMNMGNALNDMQDKAHLLGARADTVINAMNVRIGDIYYAIPIDSIRRIVTLNDQNLVRSSAEGKDYFVKLEGELVSLRLLTPEKDELPSLAVVLEGENQKMCALAIEELLGQQRTLIHPLQGLLSNSKNASGCALLEDGRIGVMLNLDAVLNC